VADRPPIDGPTDELLDRYLAGECSEDEVAKVRRYLMARPDTALALQRLLRGLDHEETRPRAPDSAASWEALRRQLNASDHAVPPTSEAPSSRPRHGTPNPGRRHFAALIPQPHVPWWRGSVAAAAVLVLLVSALVTVDRRSRRPPMPPPAAEARTFATGNGERAELKLTDGTRIRIAPATRLRVAADFGVDRRDIYLEGEAYFDVVHDERRPFTVFAGNASAQDLGTQFTVRSYADDGAVQVVVRKGAVAMSGVGRLARGDLGRLGADGRTTLKHGVSVDAYIAWLDGRLVFRDTPLGEVLRTLRRWHDVDVRMTDSSLATMPFTGELTDASATTSIELVSRVLGLRARREGTVITLERIPGLAPRPGSPDPEARIP
jgi:ferric-dicitrate binding protein FerR (iron transport regulator)